MYPNLNIKSLQLLGKGTQGRVYKIDSDKCIKFFKSKKECEDELLTLEMAQTDKHFPKLYESGDNYIIGEFIDGIELNEYLSNHRLTPQISCSLIELYEAMLKAGYMRLDAAIFHVFITSSGELKLIDTAKAMKKKSTIPNLLISGLEDLGCKEEFFRLLRIYRPQFYNEWIKYTRKKYKKKG